MCTKRWAETQQTYVDEVADYSGEPSKFLKQLGQGGRFWSCRDLGQMCRLGQGVKSILWRCFRIVPVLVVVLLRSGPAPGGILLFLLCVADLTFDTQQFKVIHKPGVGIVPRV